MLSNSLVLFENTGQAILWRGRESTFVSTVVYPESSASYRVFANQFVVIDRTKPQAAYWYPGR